MMPALESLRASIPAARSLPLLERLAQRRAGTVVLDYLDTARLAVEVQSLKLDHAWIAAHIPHQGSMCLLDEVLSWDLQRISCRSISHRAPDNPLRAHGRLGGCLRDRIRGAGRGGSWRAAAVSAGATAAASACSPARARSNWRSLAWTSWRAIC